MGLDADLTGDLADFFDAGEFGKSAVYNSLVNGTKTIKVIFDQEYLEVDLATGTAEDSVTQVQVEGATVPDAKQGDTLEIDDVLYRVTEVQPDGTGVKTLLLSTD